MLQEFECIMFVHLYLSFFYYSLAWLLLWQLLHCHGCFSTLSTKCKALCSSKKGIKAYLGILIHLWILLEILVTTSLDWGDMPTCTKVQIYYFSNLIWNSNCNLLRLLVIKFSKQTWLCALNDANITTCYDGFIDQRQRVQMIISSFFSIHSAYFFYPKACNIWFKLSITINSILMQNDSMFASLRNSLDLLEPIHHFQHLAVEQNYSREIFYSASSQ